LRLLQSKLNSWEVMIQIGIVNIVTAATDRRMIPAGNAVHLEVVLLTMSNTLLRLEQRK
jgi:hypothetical protein